MTFLQSLSQVRLSFLFKSIIFLLIVLAIVLVRHFHEDHYDDDDSSLDLADVRIGSSGDLSADIARKTLGLVDFTSLSGPELKHRIEELLRIKQSVQGELQGLEKKRKEMQQQITAFHRKIEELKAEATTDQIKLERLKLSVKQAQMAEEEYTKRNTPDIWPPLPLKATFQDNYMMKPPMADDRCTMSECFDYARCPLTSQFPIYVYDLVENRHFFENGNFVFSETPNEACVFLVIMRTRSQMRELKDLSHWNGDGRNHILLLVSNEFEGSELHLLANRAMIASVEHDLTSYRSHFDLVVPQISFLSNDVWKTAAPILPLKRRFLLSFQGFKPEMSNLEKEIIQVLQKMNSGQTDNRVEVNISCVATSKGTKIKPYDWNLCGNSDSRKSFLKASTYAVIINNGKTVSHSGLQTRLSEALECGSIPVILGGSYPEFSLPFSEQIDWRKAALLLPLSRVTELHFFLRSFKDSDLFEFKRQGNLIWKTYLANSGNVFNSIFQVIRERVNIPPVPVKNLPSPSVFGNESTPLLSLDQLPPQTETEESLGPLEQPKPSLTFRRNFSSSTLDAYFRWNTRFDPFSLPPHSPWDSVLPTDAKFLGSSSGFRPIGEGSGGAGLEFSQAIGGNVPAEQFTVVILTYEREEVLIDAIARLYALPFLNKVVVVWNTELPPSPEMRWPDIGVPVEVIKADKNSLNNRFIPYDVIETEAVLSLDDDAHLRHDEIIFGFRVWRENRDRLVGFPGRYHAWDIGHNSWNYNSNYSCELSMVLTGAAFYHKYYNYAYTHIMPQVIKEMVDEFMNCEDLAMNFLIAHVTRKPPVKVTSRWTFRCPGCPVVLSEDESHFQERHKCINFFSKVYGYMPLLFTQFRADSVLFKTRIPQDKQKCFKFI